MKFAQIIADIVCNTLLDPEVLDKARRRKGAFTRNSGKLPFWRVMKLLMANTKQSISAVLDQFYTLLSARTGIKLSDINQCTQQAFSKARSGIDHTIFMECFDRILKYLSSSEYVLHLRRLNCGWDIIPIGIDGSRITLPNRKKLLEKFGGLGKDASSPCALASIAYDSLNDIVLDAQFEPLSVDERTLAKRHMLSIKEKNLTDFKYAMFIFDRGYASADMFRFIEKTIGARYLFRIRNKFNSQVDDIRIPADDDDIVDEVIQFNENTKLRVIKFRLSSGIVETLVTNDFTQNPEIFRKLYFLRWPIEEEYKLVKEKIGLTNFRGYSENSVMQEFWISMLLSNIVGILRNEADGIIKYEEQLKPQNKNSYKCNNNELVGCLSRHFGEYMDAETTKEKFNVLRYIIGFAVKHKVVDRKGTGASAPRKKPRDCKHHYNNKCTH